jgi:hypothetical protein
MRVLVTIDKRVSTRTNVQRFVIVNFMRPRDVEMLDVPS